MMQIDDLVEVEINGNTYQVYVAGLERGFGKGSPIKKVVFYIDWDEGPIRYEWPIEQVRVLEDGGHELQEDQEDACLDV